MSNNDSATNVETIQSFKGFDKDFACRGFKFTPGKTYTINGQVKACSSGFHACASPMDVFKYYPPTSSRYALVEQSGELSRDGDDSKIASRTIKVGVEIGIPGLVKAAIEYTAKLCNPTSGDDAHSATSGDGAHSATSGRYANSATSGYGAHSATKEHGGVAANAGDGAAMASEGGAIFIVERDSERNLLNVFASKVGDNGIKPSVWYVLRDGKPTETTV